MSGDYDWERDADCEQKLPRKGVEVPALTINPIRQVE
jgi:hypothetical protein